MLSAYAAGINRRHNKMQSDPVQKLPGEFKQAGFQPSRWTPEDVAQVFVGTMAARYSDGSREMVIRRVARGFDAQVRAGKSAVIFDDVLPRTEAAEPVLTIPVARNIRPPLQSSRQETDWSRTGHRRESAQRRGGGVRVCHGGRTAEPGAEVGEQLLGCGTRPERQPIQPCLWVARRWGSRSLRTCMKWDCMAPD